MKEINIISLLIFACVQFLLAPELNGQNADMNPDPNYANFSLQQSFQASSMNSLQFEAFVDRGKQKIRDLFDYCELLSSEEQKEEWGSYLDEQVKALFISDTVLCFDQPSVPDFIAKSEIRLQQDSSLIIQVLQPFEEDKKGVFLAQMMIHYTALNLQDKPIKQTALVDLHLIQTYQTFGKEGLWVWKVLLGNIRKS